MKSSNQDRLCKTGFSFFQGNLQIFEIEDSAEDEVLRLELVHHLDGVRDIPLWKNDESRGRVTHLEFNDGADIRVSSFAFHPNVVM